MKVRYQLKTFRVEAAPIATKYGHSDRAETAASIIHAILKAEGDADVEQFIVLALNARLKVVGYKIVARGTQTATLVHPREIFTAALELRAASIIVAHNHPSGDMTPSDEDILVTERLKKGGEILGIPVIDHLIVTHDSFRSIINEV